MPLSREQRKQLIASAGFDPDKHEMDEATGDIYELSGSEPVVTEPVVSTPNFPSQDKVSTFGTVSRAATQAAGPSLGAFAAGALAGTKTPGPWYVKAGAGLLAGAGTGAGLSYLQDKIVPQSVQDVIFPSAADYEQHPWAAFGGEMIPNLLTGDIPKSIAALGRAGGIAARAALSPAGARAITAAEGAALRNFAVNTGVNVGGQMGVNAIQQALSDRPFSFSELGLNAATGLLFNEPTRLAQKYFGMRPSFEGVFTPAEIERSRIAEIENELTRRKMPAPEAAPKQEYTVDNLNEPAYQLNFLAKDENGKFLVSDREANSIFKREFPALVQKYPEYFNKNKIGLTVEGEPIMTTDQIRDFMYQVMLERSNMADVHYDYNNPNIVTPPAFEPFQTTTGVPVRQFGEVGTGIPAVDRKLPPIRVPFKSAIESAKVFEQKGQGRPEVLSATEVKAQREQEARRKAFEQEEQESKKTLEAALKAEAEAKRLAAENEKRKLDLAVGRKTGVEPELTPGERLTRILRENQISEDTTAKVKEMYGDNPPDYVLDSMLREFDAAVARAAKTEAEGQTSRKVQGLKLAIQELQRMRAEMPGPKIELVEPTRRKAPTPPWVRQPPKFEKVKGKPVDIRERQEYSEGGEGPFKYSEDVGGMSREESFTALEDSIKAILARRGARVGAYHETITDAEGKPVLGSNGRPILGRANPESRVVDLGPKAGANTAYHEALHLYLEDLARSTDPKDRALVDNWLKEGQHDISVDEYLRLNERMKAGDKEARARINEIEEPLADSIGLEGAQRKLNQGKDKARQYLKDTLGRFGLGKEPARQRLSAGLEYDAPYGTRKGQMKDVEVDGGRTTGEVEKNSEDKGKSLVEQYNEVQAKLRELAIKGDIDNPEFKALWQQSENIKNQNGGHVPKAGGGEKYSEDTDQNERIISRISNDLQSKVDTLLEQKDYLSDLQRENISNLNDGIQAEAAKVLRRVEPMEEGYEPATVIQDLVDLAKGSSEAKQKYVRKFGQEFADEIEENSRRVMETAKLGANEYREYEDVLSKLDIAVDQEAAFAYKDRPQALDDAEGDYNLRKKKRDFESGKAEDVWKNSEDTDELSKFGLEKENYKNQKYRSYGHWISPSGEMFRVLHAEGHREIGANILKYLHSKGKLSNEDFNKIRVDNLYSYDVYKALLDRGWTRTAHNSPLLIYAEHKNNLTNAQRRALKNYGIERDTNVTAVQMDRDGYDFKNEDIYTRLGDEGKLSEDTGDSPTLRPSKPLFNVTTSVTDRVATHNTPSHSLASKALKNTFDERSTLEGRYGNRLLEVLTRFSPEDVNKWYHHRWYLDNDIPSPIRLNAKQKELDSLAQPIIESPKRDAQELNLLVKRGEKYSPPGIKPEGYLPNQFDPKVLHAFEYQPNGIEAKKYKRIWKEWLVNKGAENPDEIIDGWFAARREYGDVSGPEFNALRKAEGFGLPWELMDQNPGRAFKRYAKRAAADMAFFKHIQSKEDVRHVLGIKDQFGDLPKKVEGLDYIGSEKDVQSAMSFIYGKDMTSQFPRIEAFARLVGNMIMGPGTAIRNLAAMPTQLASVDTKFRDFAKGLANLGEARKRAFETNAVRADFADFENYGGIDNPDPVIAKLDSLSAFFRKWQGRNLSDKWEGEIFYAIGEEWAKTKIAEAKTGDKRAKQLLERVGNLSENVTDLSPENISKLATGFVNVVRGTYGPQGLPAWALKGNLAPFAALSRYSIERWNNVSKDIVQPLKEGNIKPLLFYTLSALGTGATIEQINELISNRKGQELNISESLAAYEETGKESILASKVLGLLQLAAYGGVVGDMAKLAERGVSGGAVKYSSPLSFPAYSFVTETVAQNLSEALGAMREGEDPINVMAELVKTISTQSIQGVRYARNFADNKETQRKEELGDLRKYREATGKSEPESYQGTDEFKNLSMRKFKRTDNLDEAMQELPSLLKRAFEKAGNDPYKLKAEFRKLKQNSYQSLPAPETQPLEFWQYLSYLRKTQGEEVAAQRLSKFLVQREINKAKSALVP